MRFIVFAEDWAGHPSSTQHIFKKIAKKHQVTWINSVGMRTPKFNLTDINRVFSKLKMMLKPSKSDPNKQLDIRVCNPKLLPWHRSLWVQRFNTHQLSKLFDSDNPEPIIYWISVPTAISMITLRPQDKVIYYCGDDFSALAGVEHDMIAQFEKQLIECACQIFVVSENLLKKMPTNKTQILEHGVDYEQFTKPHQRHPALENKDTVLGFYGSISQWLDVELLMKLANSRPQYDLLLVGTAHIDIEKLVALPNVTHLEAISHHELAMLSQHWDVSLLPFVDNEQIRACDPLKLKEYLAVGKPIVATDFPAVHKYRSVVFIAQNTDVFIERVDHAVSISKEEQLAWQELSQSYVVSHSWDCKAEYVLMQLA